MDSKDTINDTVIAIRNVVLEQLRSSKDMNLEYKLCIDFLRNYKDEKYKEFIETRTGKSSNELRKYSQEIVYSVSKWLYDKINSLTEYQRSDLMNDPSKMDAFLKETNEYIGGIINGKQYDRPIFSSTRN